MNNNLLVRSTLFLHKDNKGTWTLPDGKTFNQVDHIIVDSSSYLSIIDVRSYWGSASDSNQYLMRVKLKEMITEAKKKQEAKTKNNNFQKLNKDEETYQI